MLKIRFGDFFAVVDSTKFTGLFKTTKGIELVDDKESVFLFFTCSTNNTTGLLACTLRSVLLAITQEQLANPRLNPRKAESHGHIRQ
jgi:hypothetical protein